MVVTRPLRVVLPLLLGVAVGSSYVLAAGGSPERTNDGTTVVSLREPPVCVSVPKTATYERMMRMLRAKGYTLPAETQNARFIHYLDDSRRRELMVIVLEDLAPTGHTVAELSADGKIQPAWNPLADALVERAKRAVRFEFR